MERAAAARCWYLSARPFSRVRRLNRSRPKRVENRVPQTTCPDGRQSLPIMTLFVFFLLLINSIRSTAVTGAARKGAPEHCVLSRARKRGQGRDRAGRTHHKNVTGHRLVTLVSSTRPPIASYRGGCCVTRLIVRQSPDSRVLEIGLSSVYRFTMIF